MSELTLKIGLPIIQEIMQREMYSDPLQKYLDPQFPKQNDFVKDQDRFIVAQCSRRAGKSNGLAIRFLHTLETHPGCFCPYIALTRESARNIMWPALEEQAAKFRAPLSFTESNLTVTHANGARLQLFGADMKNFIRRLKGIKTPGAGIDEAQDFGGHLQSLVDDVLTPTLTDYEDSWLAITGTPGPVPKGYFYEITAESKYGFSKHNWTLYDNPYLPNAKQFVADLKKKRGWDENNPTLRREWYNQWVLDVESLLIKWQRAKNDYTVVPPLRFEYILGVDIGYRDADALALLAWSTGTPNIYLLDEIVTQRQDISTLVSAIESLTGRYPISKIVMDEGGLGKKIGEEIRRRRGIPIQAADKARKMENVALLNDWLNLGHFKAREDSQFVKDSMMLQIDWERSRPDKLIVKDTFHSDIVDAVLYAFKESPAWTFEQAKPVVSYGSKEWMDKQVTEMEQKAQEYFEQEYENSRRAGDEVY